MRDRWLLGMIALNLWTTWWRYRRNEALPSGLTQLGLTTANTSKQKTPGV